MALPNGWLGASKGAISSNLGTAPIISGRADEDKIGHYPRTGIGARAAVATSSLGSTTAPGVRRFAALTSTGSARAGRRGTSGSVLPT